MENKIAKLKPHAPYIFFILLVSIFFMFGKITNDLPPIDATTAYFPAYTVYKESVLKYSDFFPLWNPYFFSGTPYLLKPLTTFGITNFLALIFPVAFAINIHNVLNVFLSGLFMYLLMHYILKDRKVALISGLIFMMSGFAVRKITETALTTFTGYVFIPLVILFLLKAFRTKDWIKYSVLTGIVLALQVHNGPGLKAFLFTGLMMAVLFIINLIGKNFRKRLIKSALIGVITGLVLSGLAAERIIPIKEFLPTTGRGHITYEQSSGRAIEPGQLFNFLIEPIYEDMLKIRREGGYGFHIGLIAFLLSLIAIVKKWSNKFVLFFIGTALVSILIATASPFYYLLWKYIPPFDSFRYVPRALSIYAFAGAALAGFGVSIIFNKYKKYKNILFIIFSGLIILNLGLFGYDPAGGKQYNVYEAIENNDVLQFISEQEGIFRMQTWEQRGIDWGIGFYHVPLGIEHIYAYDTVWYPPYFNVYLGIANQQPAKFWGILNTKYVTSTEELDIDGFKFVRKFEDCIDCYPEIPDLRRAWGPYLYENEQFLPRAYIVDSAILVIGQETDDLTPPAKQTAYALMLNQKFNPKETVIVTKTGFIHDLDLSFLNKFRAIVLTQGSINENSRFTLQQYVNQGGILLPNVIEGENSITEEQIDALFAKPNDSFTPIKDESVITHDFDTREIIIGQESSGFLVLSEKFAEFDGWRSKLNGEDKEILSVNGIISAIMLENEQGSLSLKFKPRSYTLGLTITLITAVILLLYFINRKLKWI